MHSGHVVMALFRIESLVTILRESGTVSETCGITEVLDCVKTATDCKIQAWQADALQVWYGEQFPDTVLWTPQGFVMTERVQQGSVGQMNLGVRKNCMIGDKASSKSYEVLKHLAENEGMDISRMSKILELMQAQAN